jgi:hypothetical protein
MSIDDDMLSSNQQISFIHMLAMVPIKHRKRICEKHFLRIKDLLSDDTIAMSEMLIYKEIKTKSAFFDITDIKYRVAKLENALKN